MPQQTKWIKMDWKFSIHPNPYFKSIKMDWIPCKKITFKNLNKLK